MQLHTSFSIVLEQIFVDANFIIVLVEFVEREKERTFGNNIDHMDHDHPLILVSENILMVKKKKVDLKKK